MSGEAPLQQQAPTIWEALDAWSKQLSSWQQFILRAATQRARLTDGQIDVAYDLFLLEKKLKSGTAEGDTPTGATTSGRPTETLSHQLVLKSVDGLKGVNALPSGSGLSFGPGLTVVYGRNGAGKSGFARLFANACFSRQRPALIGNIYADGKQPAPTAQFHFSIGDVDHEPVTFREGEDQPHLKRLTVFDTAVARHHITQSAAFEFKPAGFDVFPEMVRVYGRILEKLEREIALKARVNEFPAAFLGGGTSVHTAVTSLNAKTDLTALRTLAQYGATESARLTALDSQILALRAQSPKAVLAGLKEGKVDLGVLRTQLEQIQVRFAPEAVAERSALITKAKDAATVAATLGAEQFKRPFLTAVGSAEWELFVASAHGLAHRESATYPSTDDHCLLCERPLDQPSIDHIKALLTFVEGDARRLAIKTQGSVSAQLKALRDIDFSLFSAAARVRSHVHKLAPDVEEVLATTIASLVTAKDTALQHLETLTLGEVQFDLAGALAALDLLVQQIDADVIRLEADNTEASLTSLDLERRTLRHRHVLSQQMPAIETFVADAAWAASASLAKNSLGTRSITDKEKELFGRIVGDGYRARFAAECALLDCSLPVELQTVGRSGQTIRSLAMKGGHKPDAILSEGEQRAVALADFLTEVALNPASAGIILDDPVTSQDHERKERIARRLVAEAKTRQVIVFTHDLVFLNQLFISAEEAQATILPHWIDRDAQGRPGMVAANDAPATMKVHETTKRAEEALAEANTLTGSARNDAITRGMGALRRTLEETVVKKVFKDAVPRWSDQVRVTTLRRVNWDNAKVEEICELYEVLSRYIEGHSHTDEASGAPPQPADLEGKIKQVLGLVKWAKADRPKDETG
jgi:energy-coupling factor transporter ATP-binding protein EcfA2/ribosomal protein L17